MTMSDFYADLAEALDADGAEEWGTDQDGAEWTDEADSVDEASDSDGQDRVELRHLADALRQAMREDFTEVGDEDMELALFGVLDSMSAAEGINFGRALNQIGRSAGQALSDPTVTAIAKTALPVAGGALGTVIGGPVGTALGSQLGTVAAGALAAPAPRGVPASKAPPSTAAGITPTGPMASAAPGAHPIASPASVSAPVTAGSTAAAQGLVLTQHPQVLQGLLATALGQFGRDQVGGIPNAQLLGMLSQVFGRAAADADELMYLGGASDEAVVDDEWADDHSIYESLVDADNLELADALESGADL
ncbi:hypothetical protein [Knoellia aerolata]|uniref:Uncharacterized protein n=1 Tax=Knoellia aerolata DSM 18566 TaxID=1385519 RepID=A0A0A0JS03_9MICO|nr:hypothetical protein [Knoellia aerolata]KGN39943.1 hypothetical protein N801_17710 [Knoellia aerolata DSM 18566]